MPPNREPHLRHTLAHRVLTKSFVKSWDDASHSHASRPSLIALMKDKYGEVDKDVTDVRKSKYEMDMVQSCINKLREIDQKTRGSVWPVWQCWNFDNEMTAGRNASCHDEMQELIKQHGLAKNNLHKWTDIRDKSFKGPAARKVADEIWQQRWVVVKLDQQRQEEAEECSEEEAEECSDEEAEECEDEAKRKYLLTRLATIANVIHWTQYIIGEAAHYHSTNWEQVHGTPSRTPSLPPGLAAEPQLAGHSLVLPHRPHNHLPEAPEPPAGFDLERPPSRRGRHEEAERGLDKTGRYRMRRRYFGERY